MRKRVCNIPLKPLGSTSTQAYMSNAVQVVDLMQWIIDQTGPACVRVSSFSLSEEFLRRAFIMRQHGQILDLEVVLDFKATQKTLILWPFIAQTIENCYLSANHSKVMIIESDNMKVAAVMSQNLTRGNRTEATVVSSDPDVVEPLAEQLGDLIKFNSVPFHDIYFGTIEGNRADGIDLPKAD